MAGTFRDCPCGVLGDLDSAISCRYCCVRSHFLWRWPFSLLYAQAEQQYQNDLVAGYSDFLLHIYTEQFVLFKSVFEVVCSGVAQGIDTSEESVVGIIDVY